MSTVPTRDEAIQFGKELSKGHTMSLDELEQLGRKFWYRKSIAKQNLEAMKLGAAILKAGMRK
ncbi:MAG: hypothetical protein ABSG08_01065 [Terriglobales bacterium]|jgi:hypothetical protein